MSGARKIAEVVFRHLSASKCNSEVRTHTTRLQQVNTVEQYDTIFTYLTSTKSWWVANYMQVKVTTC